jgi:L-alanine-DL-glutamate epimerase-like enolase superfamily enzyme
MIEFHTEPFSLELNYPFSISNFSRTNTPIALVRLQYEGLIGYGEASMPPYLGETQESASHFFAKVSLRNFEPSEYLSIIEYIDNLEPGHHAAKAAIDIALHDLIAKIKGIPCYELLGSDPAKMPFTSFTIGIDHPEIIAIKMKDASPFHFIKVKLGSDQDQAIINTIRSISDKPIYVDANRGWGSKEHALEMIEWLATQNVHIIEQPLEINQLADMEWLKGKSPLPLFADESCRRLYDIENIANAFHGINIKLMKSTGIAEAQKMIAKARDLDLKIMMGCMSETSCGIYAAAALAPQVDYCDLDSPWMVKNNPFEAPLLIDGKIQLSKSAGLGLILK